MTQVQIAAAKYVARCRRAQDTRPAEELLREIVSPTQALELARELEWLWRR